jgi:hypothetical protein
MESILPTVGGIAPTTFANLKVRVLADEQDHDENEPPQQ